MAISQSFARCLSAATVTCSILAGALFAPAQAAVIVSFDPAFGPTIANLGFRGTATLNVTSGCYASTGFQFVGGACTITVQSARIDFYNATLNTPNTLLPNSVIFNDGSLFGPNYVFGYYIDPTTNLLTGIDTGDSGIFGVSVTDDQPGTDNDINYTGSMVLYFLSGQEPIGIERTLGTVVTDATTVPGSDGGGAFLRNCTSIDGTFCGGTNSNPATLTFAAVPEPGSVALVMLGLGALTLTRRSRAARVVNR